MRRISVLIAITLAQPALAAGVKQSIRLDRQIARMQVSQANSQPAMPLNQQPDQQPKLQREQAADLQQIYQDAKTQDATFASAQAAYQAGLERLPQGRAGLLPALSLSANPSRTYVEAENIP